MSKLDTVEQHLDYLSDNTTKDPRYADEYNICIYHDSMGLFPTSLCKFQNTYDCAPCHSCIAPSPARFNAVLTGLRPVIRNDNQAERK